MRSSKPRSRNKSNRNNNRSVGNIVNRVFDSSGPEGKVRGTPQQIIEKYNQLARDAQLGNDRVAFENFQQHAEHYTRMLGEAMKEQEARREAQERERAERQAQNQQGNQNNQNNQNNQRPNDRNQQRGDRGAGDQPMLAEPRAEGAAPASDTGVVDTGDVESGLVETPESKPSRPRRPRKPRNQANAEAEAVAPPAPDAPEAAE